MTDLIKWNGGECPVGPKVIVDYQMDNPLATHKSEAGKLDWETRDPFLAIVAYRVVENE